VDNQLLEHDLVDTIDSVGCGVHGIPCAPPRGCEEAETLSVRTGVRAPVGGAPYVVHPTTGGCLRAPGIGSGSRPFLSQVQGALISAQSHIW
jgi:hypothetical protein